MQYRARARSLLAVAACAALAGCSLPGANPYGTAVTQDELVTTTPPGTGPLDTLKWNLPYEPLSIDPMRSFNYAENTVVANMCDSLMRLTPDLKITPGLAERVDSPDPLTQVYTLRPNVRFWDGKPMTADDVAYSLNRQLNPDNGSYFANYYTKVASVQASGPQCVATGRRPSVCVRPCWRPGRAKLCQCGPWWGLATGMQSLRGWRLPATGKKLCDP